MQHYEFNRSQQVCNCISFYKAIRNSTCVDIRRYRLYKRRKASQVTVTV